MRNKKNLLYGAAIALLLATSCNNNADRNSKTVSSSDTANTDNTQPSAASSSAEKANINVTIAGGDLAGSYTATCKNGCCSWGIAGENVFGNQYSETGKGA